MLVSVVIAGLLLVVTIVMHASAMVLVLNVVRKERESSRKRPHLARIYQVSGTVLLMFVVSVAEALVWAFAYLALGAIEGLEQAVYFSMVTFTTLGYGDIVVAVPFRLLASFQAASGIIMFGWTTAIVVAVVRRVYLSDNTD
jgi:hypothetical protein